MIEQILCYAIGISTALIMTGAFVLMLWPERKSPEIERDFDIVPRIK